ncbi:hypothetical protein [Thermococcus sp.]
MRQKIAWFMALLLVVAMLQGVSATSYAKQHGAKVYAVYINGQKISVIVRNGIVQIPSTPGIDRKEVFMAVNRYFSSKHKQSLETSSQWTGSNSDYEQRKAFSIPHQGDVYISAYAYLTIEKDQFSVVAVGGYSSAACWIQPYDYWWSQDYFAKDLGLRVSLKFGAASGSVYISVPPGVGFSATSEGAEYSVTLHNTDYAAVDFDNIQASSTFGVYSVADHTSGSFYFGEVGHNTLYVEGANVYKRRG